jgi:hypothetical protein
MKILSKLLVVILALFLELVVLEIGSEILFGMSHGMMADARYRRSERLAAFFDYHEHPSPETKAKFQEEMRLMHKHEDWKAYLAIGLFVVVNGVWIYYFFRGRRRPNTALDPTPTAP